MLETAFAVDFLAELNYRFPGCFIYKMDPNQLQGIPDRLVLYRERWALLELKRARKAARQPNQEYRVDQFNEMGFSAFVSPENADQVLAELEEYFN